MVKTIAAISLVYDVSAGMMLAFLRPQMQAVFGVPAPLPPIHADLNAIFVTFVGVGYLLPYRDPIAYRNYMWIFGVGLKTAGAVAFIADYLLRGAPSSSLIFAASDALIAALTLGALVRTKN
ncbi:MAG TPA: hypothetical protein VNJ02_07105 [Vicinamibacterales bacterium]|nr:hypothetical protein [Vicinamibacterales bacterium]